MHHSGEEIILRVEREICELRFLGHSFFGAVLVSKSNTVKIFYIQNINHKNEQIKTELFRKFPLKNLVVK